MFWQLQTLSSWTQAKQEEFERARRHLKFVMHIYKMQIEAGRVFLHEHPAGASSWKLEEVQEVMNMQGVRIAKCDQCRFGLTTWQEGKRCMLA